MLMAIKKLLTEDVTVAAKWRTHDECPEIGEFLPHSVALAWPDYRIRQSDAATMWRWCRTPARQKCMPRMWFASNLWEDGMCWSRSAE